MLRKNILSRYRKPFAILMLFLMILSLLPSIVKAEDPSVGKIVLDNSSVKILVGSSKKLQATVYNQVDEVMTGQTVTWSISDLDITKVKVDQNGLVEAIGVGTATVTASYNGVKAVCEVTVEEEKVTKIKLDKSSVEMVVGSSKTLKATVYNQFDEVMTGQTVTWSISDLDITKVKVDQNGLVEAIGVGTATVTASCNGVKAKCDVAVEEAKVTKIELDNSSVKIVVGSNKTVLAAVYNQLDEIMNGQTVTWSSDKAETATVDENGLVDVIGVGTATVRASCSGVVAECEVTVEEAKVTKIELDNSSVKITVGSSKAVQATVYNQFDEIMTGQTVTWSSSKPEVATVDENGLVKAIGEGTATVTATCNGVEAKCDVAVEEAKVTKIELDNSSVKIVVGSNKTVLAAVYNQLDEIMTGQTVTWNSSKPEVATVDDKGLVTAVSVGITTITVACSGISTQCQVEVFNGYPTNLVIISGTGGFIRNTSEAYRNLTQNRNPPYQFGLKIFSTKDLDSPEGIAKVQTAVLNADAVLLEMISLNYTTKFNNIFSNCYDAKWKAEGKHPEIFVQNSAEKKNGKWDPEGFIGSIVKGIGDLKVNQNDDAWTKLNTYLQNGVIANCERSLLYLAINYGKNDDVKLLPPDTLIPTVFDSFVYHPAAQVEGAGTDEKIPGVFFDPNDYYQWYTERPEYKPDAPWVGIVVRSSEYFNNDQELYLSTLQSLEKRGINTVLLYVSKVNRNDAVSKFCSRDLGDGNKKFVDTIICPISFYFSGSSTMIDQGTITFFKEINVPILTPIYATDLEKWKNDPAGAQDVIYWQIAEPDMEGRFLPVLMGGTVTEGTDELTGAEIKKKVAVPDRIERLSGQAAAWAKLHKLANQDKKVAIIYYNHDGGKDDIRASYLNVPRSLTEILKALKKNNYTVDTDGALSDANGGITEDKVFNAMFDKGRNIGGWAPGELEKLTAQDGIIKLSLDEYLTWYNQLPIKLREAVEKDWGPAPGKVMVENGEIILPGVMSGNIFFGPQPMRGWGEDVEKIIHSSTLPPTHQYLAFYFWLQYGYKADAVVYLGTHSTAEFLPGKAVGLSGEDWPDVVQGDMPNIYPYIVNNPGEGIQAKRRLNAVLIDHLTANVANTELYGNLLELDDLTHQYDTAVANNLSAEEIENIKIKVKRILVEEGVADKISVSPDEIDKSFDSVLKKCQDYLETLEADVTPLGLHTFGVAPEGEALEAMVKAIVNFDKENRSADDIRKLLQRSTEEMDMLLLALNAGYIPPGIGNDPVRNPDVLPTGRNIQSVNPMAIPTKGAWEIGKKCADDMLAVYYAEHGSDLESVGVVLWDTETMRTEGHSFAMIMRLLGIEPVWDKKSYVTSYKIIPVEELGRPRVDVVITASGLCRDTFGTQLMLLDKAIRELAENTDDANENYIKKHCETMKSELLNQGKSIEEAEFLAASRVFAPAPGTYGTGLAAKVEATESWNESVEMVDTYLSRMGYIYGTAKDGTSVYGQQAKDTLINALKNVQAVVQVRDTIYGALDNDDFAQYYGGLTLASKWASGQDVDTYIANTRLGVNVQTLKEFVSQELDSRLLNPKFVEEMLKEGYAGSATLAEWLGNTFFIAATTGAISDNDWHDLAATYIFNDAVRAKLDPYALQSMIGYQMEAARKGMWQASSEDLTQLSNVYMQTMVDYGVVCCHHTCKNIVMNEWLAQFSTLDDSVRKQVQEILADATRKDVKLQDKSVPTTKSQDSSSDKVQAETLPMDNSVNVQPEPINLEQPQEMAKQEETVSKENTQSEATTQAQGAGAAAPAALTAVAAAVNLPAAPQEQAASQEQNTTGEQKGKTQNSKAYEISEEGKQNKASGVSMWAILGVGGAMAAVAFGMMKGKMMSR